MIHLCVAPLPYINMSLSHITSLSPPHFIEVPVPSQKSERSCISVFVTSILPLSTICLLDVRTVPTAK